MLGVDFGRGEEEPARAGHGHEGVGPAGEDLPFAEPGLGDGGVEVGIGRAKLGVDGGEHLRGGWRREQKERSRSGVG